MSLKRKLYRLKFVLSDIRFLPFYVQRQFTHPKVRAVISSFVAKLRPTALYLTNRDDVQKKLTELNDVGLTHLGRMLTSEQCIELRDYFSGKLVTDIYRSEHTLPFLPGSDERHPEAHIAHHNALDIVNAPYLLELANNPHILDIAAAFLGCKPTLTYLAAWWSYHTEIGMQHAERFHRDVDDWRFLKLFIYLTDVDDKNGPHIYVAHSSASEKLTKLRRFEDDEVVSAFGKNNVLQLTGLAGEGFFENTYGIHKGQPVKEGRRLIFQAVYSILPLPYGPKLPVVKLSELTKVRSFTPDLWINRVYIAP